MREYLSSNDICNQMSMMRTVFDGVFLIVEGVTDHRLFEKFVDKESVRIVQAHSKDKVRSTVRDMNGRRSDKKVIGIMDPDLELVNGRKVIPPLFYTDCRDMEMMLIHSNAFDDLIDEYAEREKVENAGFDTESLRQAIVKASSNVGKLMKVSADNRYNLCFKDLDFRRFINPRTVECDIRALVNAVIDNTIVRKVEREALLAAFCEEPDHDPWSIARGHDTVDVILCVLKGSIGAFNSRYLNEGELSGSLRLAFSDDDFEDTALYRSTEDWSGRTGNPLWKLIIRSRTDG